MPRQTPPAGSSEIRRCASSDSTSRRSSWSPAQASAWAGSSATIIEPRDGSTEFSDSTGLLNYYCRAT